MFDCVFETCLKTSFKLSGDEEALQCWPGPVVTGDHGMRSRDRDHNINTPALQTPGTPGPGPLANFFSRWKIEIGISSDFPSILIFQFKESVNK